MTGPTLQRRVLQAVHDTAIVTVAFLFVRFIAGDRPPPQIPQLLKYGALTVAVIVCLEWSEQGMAETVPNTGKATVAAKLVNMMVAA